MQENDRRILERRKTTELDTRRTRRISLFNLLCLAVTAMLVFAAASAYLIDWFFESPPLMP